VTARFTEAEVIAATGAAAIRPFTGQVFEGVSTDTRTLTKGSLFVALKGERFDGHEFLARAAARGASAAVVRKGTAAARPDVRLLLFEVEDTLGALGALARLHRDRFSIPIGAVAGSNGKTTTKEMVAAILRTRGESLASEGNFNNEIGVPLTLFRLGPDHTSAVLELGMSTPGELARITAIARPDAGVLTVIAAEHLEKLKDLDGVARAEGELFQNLPAGATAVVNADDPRVVKQAERTANRKILFGRSPRANVRLVEVTPLGTGGTEICLEGEEGEGPAQGSRLTANPHLRRITVQLGFVGAHNATNAAAAAALARALGFSFGEISRGLSSARPYAHRSRVIEGAPGGITVLDDCYNANPLSMEAALKTLGDLKGNSRAVAVLGDMLELGPDEESAHRALGRRAREIVDRAAFFGPRSRAAFETFGGEKEAAHFLEVEQLLGWLRPQLSPGDVVLVKGSRGMKLERVVEALMKGAS
jgi:UDP-N-acetylmuramoyl-tripeptide--D-alanyl-D-alanine ligase